MFLVPAGLINGGSSFISFPAAFRNILPVTLGNIAGGLAVVILHPAQPGERIGMRVLFPLFKVLEMAKATFPVADVVRFFISEDGIGKITKRGKCKGGKCPPGNQDNKTNSYVHTAYRHACFLHEKAYRLNFRGVQEIAFRNNGPHLSKYYHSNEQSIECQPPESSRLFSASLQQKIVVYIQHRGGVHVFGGS